MTVSNKKEETRLYTYQTEVRGPNGIIHEIGDTVHQTKDHNGYWRDTDCLEKRRTMETNPNNKKVTIRQHEHDQNFFSVVVSHNGFQWNHVFQGSKPDCETISNAFVKIGYEKE